mmetsp:Transcript_80269/g.227307  ORF Transcript_80269/g.227307 Transcript_80269/m.227307 type:complete len:320 (+) Transcript_80269:411-1370(+)
MMIITTSTKPASSAESRSNFGPPKLSSPSPSISSSAVLPSTASVASHGGTSWMEPSRHSCLCIACADWMTRHIAESRICLRRLYISEATLASSCSDSSARCCASAAGWAPSALSRFITSMSVPPKLAKIAYLRLRASTSARPTSILRRRTPSSSTRHRQMFARCCKAAFVLSHHLPSWSWSAKHFWKYQSHTARPATMGTAAHSRETVSGETSSPAKADRRRTGIVSFSRAFCTGSQIGGRSRFRLATFRESCMPSGTMPFARSSFSVFLIFLHSLSSASLATSSTGLMALSQCCSIAFITGLALCHDACGMISSSSSS